MAFNIRLLLRVIHNLTKIIFRTMQMHLNIVFQAASEYTKKGNKYVLLNKMWLLQHRNNRKTVAKSITLINSILIYASP
jgi:hypothetical protein